VRGLETMTAEIRARLADMTVQRDWWQQQSGASGIVDPVT
jgi:hypothetical protein